VTSSFLNNKQIASKEKNNNCETIDNAV